MVRELNFKLCQRFNWDYYNLFSNGILLSKVRITDFI